MNTIPVNTHTVGDIHVLTPQGRIDSLNSSHLENLLMACFAEGANKLIIDFSNASFISSAGLRILLMAAKKARAEQCKLRLCGLSGILRDVFEVSGFTSLFAIDADLASSLAAFQTA